MQRSRRPRRPRRSQGFTLLELAAVVIVLALIAGLVLPMLAPPRGGRGRGRQMQNSIHLRGIHSGMVLFAQDNKDFYPGLDATGAMATTPLPGSSGAEPTTVGGNSISPVYGTASVRGYDPTYRMAVLLRGNYFSPEYMRSPAESNPLKTVIQAGQNLTSNHFSYAMLRLDQPGEQGEGGRRSEWRATMNSRAAVMSDRNIGAGAGSAAQSIHTAPGDGWRGGVVYNDNHANYETTNILSTAYAHEITRGLTGTTGGRIESVIKADDLFADDQDDGSRSGNDAAMVHQDETTYADQK